MISTTVWVFGAVCLQVHITFLISHRRCCAYGGYLRGKLRATATRPDGQNLGWGHSKLPCGVWAWKNRNGGGGSCCSDNLLVYVKKGRKGPINGWFVGMKEAFSSSLGRQGGA